MLKLIELIGNTLVQLLQPLLEVSVFEAGRRAPIIAIHKFEAEVPVPGDAGEPVIAHTHDGRVVKAVCFNFEDAGKKYIAQFRADISVFTLLQQQLSQIIGQPIVADLKGNWQQQITDSVQNYLSEQQISLAGITRQQKRELVFKLKQQRLLDYKEATAYLAKILNTSRATIYNYLQSAQALTPLTIHQVNSFSDKPSGGNPAGVVLDAENLDAAQMSSLARELNYSETAFLLPSAQADFRLRYFSREGIEVNFCGHSTVGALFMLAKEKYFDMKKAGDYRFQLETNVGIIDTEIHINSQQKIFVTYQSPVVNLVADKLKHAFVAENLGISAEIVDTGIPIMIEKTNRAMFVKIQSLKALENLQIDFRKLKILMKQHDLISCCLLVPETFHSVNDIHMRCFSPIVGVNEDPFTGSVLGGLAAYVHQNHIIDGRKRQFNVEQGHFVNRPGEVTVLFDHHHNKYHVKVQAKARHFFSTEVELIGGIS